MVGEISGLNDSLTAERERSARLMKRKRGLEEELKKLKENAHVELCSERSRWEDTVADLRKQLSSCEESLKVGRETVVAAEKREAESAVTLREQVQLVSDLESKLQAEITTVKDMKKAMQKVQEQRDQLQVELNAMPSKEVIVSEFRSGAVYKKEILEAQAVGVAAYRGSREF